MNPMMIAMKLQGAWSKFSSNHPRLSLFFKAVSEEGIKEDTIISVTVKTPEGKTFETNVKILPDDMELINSLKDMGR